MIFLIACQSPLEGGSAVYGARTMIGLDYECANGENRSMTVVDEFLIEEEQGDFLLYPNPSNGTFTIESQSTELENGVMIVMDISGKEITTIQLNSNQTSIDMSELAEGMYHYLIYSGKTLVFTNKFVISK